MQCAETRLHSSMYLLTIHTTGCRRCGHDGGRKGVIKQHNKRNACPCCSPPTTEEQEQGFFCTLKPVDQACQCAYHMCKDEREFMRVRPFLVISNRMEISMEK